MENEYLDRFIVMGCGHLDHLVGEYMEHYNTERPHSGIGYRVPEWENWPLRLTVSYGYVSFRTQLGGVLRCHERVAGQETN